MSAYFDYALRRFGVSEHTPDLTEVMEPNGHVMVAYCSSKYCAGSKTKVLKKVQKYAEICPECGYFLFWRPKRKHEIKNKSA